MKLFVDDIRRCPEGWTPARTVTEAIRILATQDVEEVSLDHDICCEPASGVSHSSWETFEAVAWFLAAISHPMSDDRIKVRIHTANVAAGQRMADILGIDYNNEIFNPADYEIKTDELRGNSDLPS